MPSENVPRARNAIRRTVAALCLAAAGILLAGCATDASAFPGADSTASATPGGSSDGTTSPAAGTALAELATIPVKGKAPRTGYDRVGDFGSAWKDVDHNHCDTRDDVLARDLTDVMKRGTCTVESGVLSDPYTGKTIHFVRGVQTSALVQIDHVVPLSNAWQTGAQQLTQQQRETLANDPLNLLAVDGPTNEGKGDGDAATWLPPNRGFWCDYAARQVSVKAAYHLWVAPAEHDALQRILGGCPAQAAPTSTLARTVGLG
ncbi:HNH endonuclease family protein [Humibacter ginsengisoli]